jgi:hypothetical protein
VAALGARQYFSMDARVPSYASTGMFVAGAPVTVYVVASTDDLVYGASTYAAV